jgi:hypothetical protein
MSYFPYPTARAIVSSRHKLTTLWDMLKFYAHVFVKVLSALARIHGAAVAFEKANYPEEGEVLDLL